MKFKRPEDLSALKDDALAKLLDAALDEYSELVKIADSDLTDEQLDDMEALRDSIKDIRGERKDREEAVASRAERIANAKALDEEEDEDKESEDESGDQEEAKPEDAKPEGDQESDEDEQSEDAEEKEGALVASGKQSVTKAVARATRRQKAVEQEEEQAPEGRTTSIVAAADVRGFANGQAIDMDGLTKAFMNRIAGMPKGRVGSQFNKYGVGQITISPDPTFEPFTVTERMGPEEAWRNIMAASRESNLGQSLVAAGGWCAPSVNLYDLLVLETATGALDLPEVTIVRGGINFTKGPDFSDIYTNTGFLQTEADAIAGTAKTFLEVDCPDWEEIRLDAIGYGVKAPILTASPAGFPELVRRYIEGAAVAHFHKVNAYVINKVLGYLGTAQDFGELGSASGDLLNAIEIAAWSLRYKYRMAENATFEAMFPMWVKGALRADLARRTGVENFMNVTDAQINGWFGARGIRPQFVYDWAGQDISSTALQYNGTVRFGIWPAGAFVKGTNNIISLDAIYDSTEITTNTYTAAFFEEAILVANTGASGRLFEVALDLAGRTGAADIGVVEAS